MAATTPNRALPYLEGGDLASDIDQGFEDLATAIDDVMVSYSIGLFSELPPPTPELIGSLYYATDIATMYFCTDPGWVAGTAFLGLNNLMNEHIDDSAEIAVTKLKGGSHTTATPSSPVDSQEFTYRFTDNLSYVHMWRFKYRSSGSQNWKFVGGAPLAAAPSTTGYTRASTSYGSALTNTTVTVPLTGRYIISWGGHMAGSGSAYLTAGLHVNGTLQTEGELTAPHTSTAFVPLNFSTGRNGNQFLTAGDTIDIRLKCSAASTCTMDYPFVSILPISLGT